MGTYLSICKDVARESGVVPTWASISTMQDQTGRIQRIGEWVNTAHKDVQMAQEWLWLVDDFSGALTASTQRYSATSILSAADAARFSKWDFYDRDQLPAFSIYLTSDGQSKEQHIQFVPWQRFRRAYMFGVNATETGQPSVVSVDPQQQLVFYPIPDAAYTVRGLFKKNAQTLTEDDDTPEMPADFHDIIMWKALGLLGLFDEAGAQMPGWEKEERKLYRRLMGHQLPEIKTAGPIA